MNATNITDTLDFWGNMSMPDDGSAKENITGPLTFPANWSKLSEYVNRSYGRLSEHINAQTTGSNSRDSLALVATITAFYILIFIAGIIGNLITCTVISRNKFMHTATNYYLFNLAISDLILLISGMPPDLFSIWYPTSYPFTDFICILQGLLSETSANATVLTITAFTVERYIAICHPFRQHTMSKLSRAVKFILAIWCAAFILATPQAMQFGVVKIGRGKSCTVKNNFFGHAFEVSSFVFFVGPMTAICVLYVLIGIKLKKSKLLQGAKRKGDVNRGISGQTKVIRMLVAVAVAFFLCWAPFHAQRLVAVYGATGKRSVIIYKIYAALTYISGVLYFLSTCINPLLYNIMSYKFRDAFKLTLARQFGLGSKYQTKNNHNYSALSRQNGSMRFNTTVISRQNNSYMIEQLHKRDSDFSLQDSTRSKANRHLRCISVSSQSTLMTSLSKNDVFAPNPAINRSDLQISAIDDQAATEKDQLTPTPSPTTELPPDENNRPSIIPFPMTNNVDSSRTNSHSLKSLRNSNSCSNGMGMVSHPHYARSRSSSSHSIQPTILETISELFQNECQKDSKGGLPHSNISNGMSSSSGRRYSQPVTHRIQEESSNNASSSDDP